VSAVAASASLVPWIGAGVAAYAVVVAAAVLLCAAGHEDEPAAVAAPGAGRGDDPTPERLVAHVARLLDADAALFGWDPRADAPRLLAASRSAFASGAEGRHLAREAVVAGRPASCPPLHVAAAPAAPPPVALAVAAAPAAAPPVALAVPAAPAAAPPVALAVPAERRGALCVSRPAARPFSATERSRLAELGLLAADVLREQAELGTPVRGVPA